MAKAYSDDELIELLKSDPNRAMITIIERYGKMISLMIMKVYDKKEHRETIEDLKMETLEAIWENRGESQPTNLEAYLCGVAVKHAYHHLRDEKRRKAGVDEVSLEEYPEAVMETPGRGYGDPEEEIIMEATLRTVWEFFDTISETEKMIYLDRYVDGQSIEETAAKYGTTKSNITTICNRVKRKLEKYMKEKEFR